jgi:pimeloyl-ACP methyl ester carboxylesterase
MKTAAILKDTAETPGLRYGRETIDGVELFFREAGDPGRPAIILLHGFPTSSHMFRNLIPQLSQDYHVIAPDYPGFGHSAMPQRGLFDYSFDHYAELMEKLFTRSNLNSYALYVFDYGAPVGFRLFQRRPERVTAIISQNGNAYEEGLSGFWGAIKAYWNTHGEKEREALRWLTSIKATRWQYENGVPQDRIKRLSPDGWQHDQSLMDRPGNAEIQLDLFYDYRTNLPQYPKWQEAFRQHKPPLLAVWGKYDEIFAAPGAKAFKKDLPGSEIHLLDAGHFALETHGDEIASLMRDFLDRNVGHERK